MKEVKPFYTYFTWFALVMAVVFLPFSIKLCHFALFLLIFSWILQGQWKAKWDSITGNAVILIYVIFFAVHLIGLLYTEDTANGWFNIEKKISWIILPIILVSMPRLDRKYIDLLFLFFVAACFIGTVLCIFNAIIKTRNHANIDLLTSSLFWSLNPNASKTWFFFSYTELASGIELHPTYFSMYLVFCLLLLYKLFHRDFFTRSKGFQALLAALAFYFSIFIICLASKITTLAFLFFISVGAYRLFKKQSQLMKFTYSLCVACFLALLIYFNPVSRYRNYQEAIRVSYPAPKSEPYNLSTDIRASLWWLAMKSVSSINLIWGAGTGDVEQVMKNAGTKYTISNILGTNDPHSEFLYTLLSLGLIGLICLLGCFAWPGYLAYRQQDFFYIAFVGLFIFVSLTETTLELQKGIVFFSIFNSILIFQYADWSVSYKKRLYYV